MWSTEKFLAQAHGVIQGQHNHEQREDGELAQQSIHTDSQSHARNWVEEVTLMKLFGHVFVRNLNQ